MLRFKNILAVIEHGEPLGSEIDHALKLARLNGAAITIMETCNYLPEDVLFSLEGGSGRQVMKEFEDRRRARLTEVASRWEDLDPTLLLPAGKPFLDIVRRVMDAGHDLVVKAAEAPPTGSSRLFGSVDMHLIRKCPSAVWLHKPGADGRVRRILACVDLDADDALRQRLNTAIMEMATSFAREENSSVDAAHAWWLPFESTLRDSIWLSAGKDSVDELVATRRTEAEARFSGFVKRFAAPDIAITTHFLKGDPRVVLPEFCRETDYDLIVMGTVTNVGLPGYFIGETAETLLSEVSASVLTVKPEGWVSPLAAASQ
ncbi:MAG: universal stress protein [Gemmatimonadota bacterium]|nr:universal stress protein [Gemmatimonadota bacterium]